MLSIPFPSPTVLVVASLLTIYIVIKATYALFIHPLAKYPGPFLAKFTTLYASYHGWRGDIHLDMYRCHEKYGNYVRYGPNALLFNTPTALKDIYSNSSASNYIKGDAYAPLIHRAPNTLTIRGGKEHARRRRIMAQGVSEKAQRGYEGRVIRHIEEFCRNTVHRGSGRGKDGSWSEPMDMSKWTYYLSFDIMSDVVFGAQYNLLGSESFRYVTECIDKSNVRMSTLIQAPWYATLKLDKYLFRDAIKARNRFIKFVMRVIKDRMNKMAAADKAAPSKHETDTEGLDMFGVLASARDPETGTAFNPNEIAAESTTLIVAGSDTSSTAMAGILFYLAHNASAYAKAAEEVRTVFARPEEVCMGAALVSCTYLRACIDESLRMSPPVGSSLWREVVAPTGSVTIDGRAVPSGTNVGVSIYSLHHNAACYDQPFTYIPERWLGSSPTVDGARAAFTPFSIGTRGCLGKGLAQTEMLLTMARVLVAGDFRLADGELGKVGNGQAGGQLGREHVGEYQLWDHVTCQKMGPWLQFAARGEQKM